MAKGAILDGCSTLFSFDPHICRTVSQRLRLFNGAVTETRPPSSWSL